MTMNGKNKIYIFCGIPVIPALRIPRSPSQSLSPSFISLSLSSTAIADHIRGGTVVKSPKRLPQLFQRDKLGKSKRSDIVQWDKSNMAELFHVLWE